MTETSEYLDAVFDALQSTERRHTLRYLHEDADQSAELDDIATYLADETGTDQTVSRAALVHNHLPHLQDNGWVDYDERSAYVKEDIFAGDTKDELLLDYMNAAEAANTSDDDLDSVFETLTDEERRRTLYTLEHEEDRKSTVPRIVDHLAGSDDDPENVRITLHHRHLPLLQDQGWVKYDSSTGKVSLTVNHDEDPDGLLLDYLEQAYSEEA